MNNKTVAKDHIVKRIVNAEIKATYFVRIGAYYLGRYNNMTIKFDEARTFENSRLADMAFNLSCKRNPLPSGGG